MVAVQHALALSSIQAQTQSAELSMQGQQAGALADAGVQLATEQAQSAKDGIRAVGESFAKAV